MKKFYKKISILLVLIFFSLTIIFPSQPALAQNQCGYSLDSLARKYSGFGGVPWYSLVEDSQVIGAADKTDITYSTTQGNWLPINTYTDTDFFRLNVNGERNQGGADPRTGYQVKYRVWGDTEVSVKTKTWGETGGDPFGWWGTPPVFQVRMDRIDTFQRQSDTSILINGVPQIINVGDSYEIQNVGWAPGDNGSAYSYLSISNLDSGYFDIHQEVWEYDEEFDSAHVRIESYIESVGAVVCPPTYQDIGLRVFNGTQTVSIAAEPLGTLTSPLRIAKNGVIYGIALVDPGDPNDSGVRIQTSSGIKALRRL